MKLNTSKAVAWALVAVGVICQVSPALAKALSDAGLPAWSNWVLVGAGVLSQLKLVFASSVSDKVRIQGAAEVPNAAAKVSTAVSDKVAAQSSFRPPPMPLLTWMGVLLVALFALCLAALACTPAQLAAVSSGFNYAQAACSGLAMANAEIPPGVLPAQVSADLKLACSGVTLADVTEQDIEAFITSWQAGQSDAGAVMATIYRAPTLRRAPFPPAVQK